MKSKTQQWLKLLGLSFVHIIVDLFPGSLAVIMPALQKTFNFSMAKGITLLAVMNLTCNFIQVVTGHIRENKSRPLLLPVGVVMVGAMSLIALLPQHSYTGIMFLILISAVGIAFTHPESIRAIHKLDLIKPATASMIYVNSGYIGFAIGGSIAAYLISHWQVKGLIYMALLPVLAIIILIVSKIKLSTEADIQKSSSSNVERISFKLVMAMTVPFTTATVMLTAFLPQYINTLNLKLTYGGIVVMTFIAGTVTGSVLWSEISKKLGLLKTATLSLILGLPFLYAYLFLITYKSALILLFTGGMLSGSVFPLFVTMGRFAKGMSLGRKMGFLLGGTWGIACTILFGLGPVAENFGVAKVLFAAPVFYLISAVVGITAIRNRTAKNKALQEQIK